MNQPQLELQKAIDHVQMGRFRQAESLLRKLLRRYPEDPMAHHLMGIVWYQTGFSVKAETSMREAIKRAPAFMPARNNLATVLVDMKRKAEARTVLTELIRIQPGYIDAYCNLAKIMIEEEDNDQACSVLAEGLLRSPEHPVLLNLMSIGLRRRGELAKALVTLERLLEIQPDHPDAQRNISILALQIGNADYAVKVLAKCLMRTPSDIGVLLDLSRAHLDLSQIDEAMDYCEQAITLAPDDVNCLYQRAVILARDGQHQAADDAFSMVLSKEPGHIDALRGRMFASNYHPYIRAEQSYQMHIDWARRFIADVKPGVARRTAGIKSPNDQLTIGFVSGDFCQHAVSFFFLPLVRNYNKSGYRFICYYNRHKEDDISRLLASLVDGFINIADLDDDAVIARIHQDHVDILVDMSGHTAYNRLGVFARKPVAMQVAWLGYPNTTGLEQIDYRITDPLIECAEAQSFSSERLLFLDQGFLCFEMVESVELDVCNSNRRDSITFGCFNNFRKINDELMAWWAEILQKVPGSRLLMKYDQLSNKTTRDRVLDIFADKGISPDRIELIGRLASYREHLEHYRKIDIALDTYPYNGTTTTLEAINMGVPVVTLCGDRHASRVGYAILLRLGLSDLVAFSSQEYVGRAVSLAQDLSNLNRMRAKLRDQVVHSSLMQGSEFASAFLDGLREAYSQLKDG